MPLYRRGGANGALLGEAAAHRVVLNIRLIRNKCIRRWKDTIPDKRIRELPFLPQIRLGRADLPPLWALQDFRIAADISIWVAIIRRPRPAKTISKMTLRFSSTCEKSWAVGFFIPLCRTGPCIHASTVCSADAARADGGQCLYVEAREGAEGDGAPTASRRRPTSRFSGTMHGGTCGACDEVLQGQEQRGVHDPNTSLHITWTFAFLTTDWINIKDTQDLRTTPVMSRTFDRKRQRLKTMGLSK